MIEGSRGDTTTGSHLTLDVWHPDCWTLEVTEEVDGGLLGHGVYRTSGGMKGRFTAYGETESDLDGLLEAIDTTPLTDSVWLMDQDLDGRNRLSTPGNFSRSMLVEYDHERSINDALVDAGFIPERAVWIHDGREYWTVVIEADRDEIQDRLDEIREEMNAEIRIRGISSGNDEDAGVLRKETLSERQRDVFELARRRGYYNWPREVTATELAESLDISKATFLEHLRKAEAKLLKSLP